VSRTLNTRQQVDVCIGKIGTLVGRLIYVKQGPRQNATFAYDESWLTNPERIQVSPDLPLVSGYQPRKAPTREDSVFHFAIADTEPDAWGRRIIARAHAKRRKTDPTLNALTEMDYLLAVDDFSRVGALRLRDHDGKYLQTLEQGKRATPPVVDLKRIYDASQAVERGQETAEDLRYLQGKGTSLGGMRPKCTILDSDGALAIGKFPSIADARSVTRGEVLALRLARLAGIESAVARIVELEGIPVAIIERFDRDAAYARIPYLSAASMLQASRHDDHSYTEIADIIRAVGISPTADVHELWRRILFNLLITNVDDHLQNHGFLYVSNGQWRLAPAFDMNPFPDKDRESKTWLSPEEGPIDSVEMLMARGGYFGLTPDEALRILREVYTAVVNWRDSALSAAVGLKPHELEDFAPAFEHDQLEAARSFLSR
jgi:serine/threonine-protein kinase HipA